jgi:ABC-type transport system involved in multi-copper enzyme maturation permease subunit
MDAATPAKPVRINRWLPYWAVFQADVRQTLNSWVYRTWVLVSILATVGYLLYSFGVLREAGIRQPASKLVSDLLRWTLLGSVTLIIVLTAGCISSERGTMADSVLSRGISRYQYFMGKWHARLATILCTFLLLGAFTLIGSFFLLHDDLSLMGSLVALAMVAVLLAAVISCGVTVSAMANSSVLGIAVLWLTLYGGGFLLSILPARLPLPDWSLANLTYVLQGYYDVRSLGRLACWSAGFSFAAAIVGLIYFSRRDV